MFNPSEMEGEVDHSFFDSDSAENSRDVGHKVEKGLKAEKEIPAVHRLCAKHRENYQEYLSSKTYQNRNNLKQVENKNSSSMSSFSSDSEDFPNLHTEIPSGTFMSLLSEAKELNDTDDERPKETKEEALPFSVSSERRNEQSPKKLKRNDQTQSPSGPRGRSQSPTLSSDETSTNADSEGNYSSSSQRSSLKSTDLTRPSSSSSCPGVKTTRAGSARPQDLPTVRMPKSEDTVTDVTPFSSPDASPLQSLDLNVTEVEEESHKEEQPWESVPSSGFRNMHQDEDPDQDVDECSLNLESQLGRKQVFDSRVGRNRKNYSFSNDDVRRIDLENQRLLRELSRLSSGSIRLKKTCRLSDTPTIRAHSAVNRQREQQRIEMENLAFLKRLESVKPTASLRRSAQLADYQRLTGYPGVSSYPSCRSSTKKDRSSSRTASGPRQVSSRAAFPLADSSSTSTPRSKTGATQQGWC